MDCYLIANAIAGFKCHLNDEIHFHFHSDERVDLFRLIEEFVSVKMYADRLSCNEMSAVELRGKKALGNKSK